MIDLSPSQNKILRYLEQCSQKGSNMPTLAEIASHFGLSNRSTIRQHLQALEKKGFIKRVKNSPRGITLLRNKKSTLKKPIIGQVAAGNPLVIYNDQLELIELPALKKLPESSFLLKVKGNSLKDSYICDGDVIMVQPNPPEIRDGNVIVAIINDEAVVKKYYKRKNSIELHSENPAFPPLKIPEDELRAVGLVIGVYRTML